MNHLISPRGTKQLRKARFSQPNNIYFITSNTKNRQAIFTDFRLACKAIQGFTEKGRLQDSQLLCWVLMPDHAHWLIQLGAEKSLSSLVGSMKASATRQLRLQGFTKPVWQSGFYDHALRKEDDVVNIARYIVANPTRAGLVKSVRNYPYWDAVYL